MATYIPDGQQRLTQTQSRTRRAPAPASVLQRAAINTTPGPDDVPPIVLEVLRTGGRALDANARALMEPRFGRDFSEVRVHTDDRAAESARAVNALAYTVGNDVVFGAGQYAPHTPAGQRVLGHELTHVMQQHGQGRQAPASVTLGSPTASAEHEAEGAAQAIVEGRRAPAVAAAGGGIQRDPGPGSGSGSGAAGPANTGSFKVNMTPFVTGLKGTIEFDPDAKNCPKCSKIRLVQVVRVFDKPGQDYTWPGAEAPREKVKTAEDKAKGVKANYFVDHSAANCSAGKGCSLYYRDHWANATLSQDGSNDGTAPKKASLWDSPTGDADDIFELETCARCHDTGAFLRSVQWGFTADSKGKVTPSPVTEQAAPSATFAAAVSTFNKYYGNK